jgi:hypothetical protein
MAAPPADPGLRDLAREIEATAREAFASYCPLYEALARSVAAEPELLQLASRVRPGQAPALVLLDTVHYLLLRGERHPLSAFYLSLTDTPSPPEEAPPAFADFCRGHREELERLLPTRLVQTNEVRRCALLLPALGLAAREAGAAPLALVALGASAGLNLLFDRCGYDYGGGRRCGDPAALLQLPCQVRGPRSPPLPKTMPAVAARVGIDLNPLDLRNRDRLLWLLGQIWPNEGYRARAERVLTASEAQRRTPPRLVTGDVLEVLPDVAAGVSQDQSLCLLHSYTVYELPPEARARLDVVVARCAASRPLACVGLQWDSHHLSWLDLAFYGPGGQSQTWRLARCQTHGEWIEWLGGPPPGP